MRRPYDCYRSPGGWIGEGAAFAWRRAGVDLDRRDDCVIRPPAGPGANAAPLPCCGCQTREGAVHAFWDGRSMRTEGRIWLLRRRPRTTSDHGAPTIAVVLE